MPGYKGDFIDLAGAIILGSILLYWFYLEHSGYKFGYSAGSICSRPAGLIWNPLPHRYPFSEVAYAQISDIKKVFQGNAKAKQRFFAFDYLSIVGRNGEAVMLYPDGMWQEDFQMILQKIYEKRPDVFVKKWQKKLVNAD